MVKVNIRIKGKTQKGKEVASYTKIISFSLLDYFSHFHRVVVLFIHGHPPRTRTRLVGRSVGRPGWGGGGSDPFVRYGHFRGSI